MTTSPRPALPRPAVAVTLLVLALIAGVMATSPWLAAAAPRTGPAEPPADDPSAFRVATFNLLGHGHTEPGGDRRGFADSRKRTDWALKLLDRRAIEVAGFQEFQPEQHQRFVETAGDAWDVYPGDQLSRAAMHNSIAWRTGVWELVQADSIRSVYTRGALIRMPVVLLRHLESGRLVWFANFHNASNPKGAGNQQKYRDQARNGQIDLANRLWESGAPLIITGDMNERDKYFCEMTRKAPMKAAQGGSYGATAPCDTPDPTRIDWIFGSSFVTFSGFTVLESKLVRKTTDHPLIFADVTVPARRRP